MLEPDPAGSQVYVVAPLAVSVAEAPLHNVVDVGVTLMLGALPPTVTVTVAGVLLQLPFEPETV